MKNNNNNNQGKKEMSSQEREQVRSDSDKNKWKKRTQRWNAWKTEQAKAKAEDMMLERSREER